MRIDKLLANMGYGSRKEVNKLLKTGVVSVNLSVVKDGKVHVNPGDDTVVVLGEEVNYHDTIYLMMNKPKGVISATRDANETTVIDLLDPKDNVLEPFPVGRLDKDTEGLLLLTNDGKLAHRLLSPKHHVEKIYEAVIIGEVTVDDIDAFAKGVILDDDYETKPAMLEIIDAGPESKVVITITEGKFHQIKRMFEAVGKEVSYLKRREMGSLKLDPMLSLGSYRPLSSEEISALSK